MISRFLALAQSPSTKTFSCPGIRKSGSTSTLSFLLSMPEALIMLEPFTPALHKVVFAFIFFSPSSVRIITPSLWHFITSPRTIFTPFLRIFVRALALSAGLNIGKICSPRDTSVIFTRLGAMPQISQSSFALSPSSLANSTPVKPLPTTTKLRSFGSLLPSKSLNFVSSSWRIFVAQLIVARAKVCLSAPSMPK